MADVQIEGVAISIVGAGLVFMSLLLVSEAILLFLLSTRVAVDEKVRNEGRVKRLLVGWVLVSLLAGSLGMKDAATEVEIAWLLITYCVALYLLLSRFGSEPLLVGIFHGLWFGIIIAYGIDYGVPPSETIPGLVFLALVYGGINFMVKWLLPRRKIG